MDDLIQDSLGSVMLPSMKVRQKKLCQEREKSKQRPFYKDTSNFGVRMLAKLGWSEGKGLGKDENGITVPLTNRIKQNSEGIGFVGGRDDQWTQHDTDFNNFLKRLNGEEDVPAEGGGTESDPKSQLQSLEERSKKSRARVHYKKFTRGKDLTQMNDKDLANIFGKRSLADINEPNEPLKNDSSGSESEEECESKRPVLGLSTIKASVSMQEYFQAKMKQKMLANGARANGTLATSKKEPEVDPADEEHSSPGIGKCKVKKNKKNSNENEDSDEESSSVDIDKCKVKKNKKKHYEIKEPLDATVGKEVSQKKSKRNRDKMEQSIYAAEEVPVEPEGESQAVKKKKFKKQISLPDPVETCEAEQEEQTVELPGINSDEPVRKKKKSKRSKSEASVEAELDNGEPNNVQEANEPTLEDSSEPVNKKKKSKKNKKKPAQDDDGNISGELKNYSDGKNNSNTEEQTTVQLPATAASSSNYPKEEELTFKVKVDVLKYLDETRFCGSNFADIIGYRLTEEVKLVKNDVHRKKLRINK